MSSSPPGAPPKDFEEYQERRPVGLVGRFFITVGQIFALVFGGINAYVRQQRSLGPDARRTRANALLLLTLRFMLFFVRPFLNRRIIELPFPIQFRKRLELLGPTYIKLGQILSLREDLLPRSMTDELKHLLDRLPVVSYTRYKELIAQDLRRPLQTIFRWIDPQPLGSASLAQTHRARLLTGEQVVLKVLKPGVRKTVETDTKLLRLVGRILQVFVPQFQPRRLIDEFCRYTLREVDLRFEADNAETFTANFKNQPRVHFPRIYREFSNRDVLCMQYFRGIKPDAHAAEILTRREKDQVIQLGMGATLQMIFKDGFFHADLHPANLFIFRDASIGYIDLGMVGVFDREMRRRLLYYFYALVVGDPEIAARYLASLALPSKGSDKDGFERAVSGLYGRWLRSHNFKDFSLAQVILQSLLLSGQYRMQFPSELVLVVKALVTAEAVTNVLEPGIDIVKAARGPVARLMYDQFNPVTIVRSGLLAIPELVDILNRSPLVMTEALEYYERNIKKAPENPNRGLQRMVLVGALILAAAILYAAGAPWFFWGALALAALIGLLWRQT